MIKRPVVPPLTLAILGVLTGFVSLQAQVVPTHPAPFFFVAIKALPSAFRGGRTARWVSTAGTTQTG